MAHAAAKSEPDPERRHAVSNQVSRRGPAAAAFADSRPEALAQRWLSDSLARSPRLAAQGRTVGSIRSSPSLLAQRRKVAGLFGDLGQRPGSVAGMGREARSQPGHAAAQRRVTKTLRQQVKPVVSMPALVEEVRGWWRRYFSIEPHKFPDHQLLGRQMRDEDIAAEAASANYLTDNVDHKIGDVAEAIYARLRIELLHRQAVLDSQPVAPGMKAAVLATSAETPGLRARPRLPSPDIDLHAPAITFRAVAGVLGSAEALNGWELGITQTVLKVDRRFKMRVKHDGKTYVQEQQTTLAAPTNDRNSGATAPWYNEHKPVGGRGPVDVSLMDMPGESFSLDQGATIDALQIEGADLFGTWVILWHQDTQSARFLGGWTWAVDYGDPAGARTTVSGFAPLNGQQPSAAVLLGARCRDVLSSTGKPLRLARRSDDLEFAATERREQAVLGFRKAGAELAAALKRATTEEMTMARDRLLQAWKALGRDAAQAETSDLLRLLDDYEMTVHRRRPSQDALKATYGIV